MNVRSGDADLFYEVQGAGFPVLLIHPFPASHEFWLPVAPMLSSRYRLLLPDLPAHGRSGIGEGHAGMAKQAEARKMMNSMRAENIATIQRGMADRPDSVATLKNITVPTLIIAGSEDTIAPLPDAELMRSNIARSQMEIIDRAGHYAIFEYPQISGRMIRQFLDSQNLSG